MLKENWFTETFKDAQGLAMQVSKIHYHKRSEFQDILIFENPHYGTVMALDNAYMLSDVDEHMYHKAITSYGMQNISSEKQDLNILVIGAGDGGVVRDLFANYNKRIKHVSMVEIDEDVIKVSREFFPEIASALDHPKLTVRCEDALAFVKASEAESFDLVLCDSTDPEGFAAGLIEEDFYRDIQRIMKTDAIFCAQSGSPFFQKEELLKTQKNISKVFSEHHTYFAPMLVYPGSIWSYTAAGAKILNKQNLDISEFIPVSS